MKSNNFKSSSIFKYPALGLIRLYQKTLSFDHGPLKVFYHGGFCRYEPTCSQYSYEAIDKYGLAKGSFLGFRRLLRCHPWAGGGHDPVV